MLRKHSNWGGVFSQDCQPSRLSTSRRTENRGPRRVGKLTIFWPRSRLSWAISSWHSTKWSCKNRSSGKTLPQMTCPAGFLLSVACGRPIANSSVGGGATHTCAWYVRWCASRDANVG